MGRMDTAKLLIKAGANVNIVNRNGDTPIHIAIYNYNSKKNIDFINTIKLLLNTMMH